MSDTSGKYITESELKILLEDLTLKLDEGKTDLVRQDLRRLIEDLKSSRKYIDRTYLAQVKAQKRKTKIAEIATMLESMSNEQVDNVHVYVVDEYAEPDHEAAALDLILKLSRENKEK